MGQLQRSSGTGGGVSLVLHRAIRGRECLESDSQAGVEPIRLLAGASIRPVWLDPSLVWSRSLRTATASAESWAVVVSGPPDTIAGMDLIVGAARLERILTDAEGLVTGYLTDDGLRYLDFVPTTPPDRLVPEDLAVTILINSRVAGKAFKSVQDFGPDLALSSLPTVPLQEASAEERRSVAALIATVASWPGFATSVATKVLHKKRPDLIPILDNEAIFGAYMNPRWPTERASQDSVYGEGRIREALDWIATDLSRSENQSTWLALERAYPTRTRTDLFDMAWWTHFRRIQPVTRPV